MTLREKVENKGLKQKWIAKKLEVSEAMISFVLDEKRTLSYDKEIQLNKLLS